MFASQALAERLLGREVSAVRSGRAGGNNRIFRIEADGGPFCLKLYPRLPGDRRDRLGTEFAALEFLACHGVSNVPKPVAADRNAGAALYSWLDGQDIDRPDADQITAVLSFIETLDRLRLNENALDLPLASEACLSPGELVAQIERRLVALAEAGRRVPALGHLLEYGIVPLAARWTERFRANIALLTPALRTLSPSDLGFHNALIVGTAVAFFDFEYFGWDDPVKLTADFLLHPGMVLNRALKQQFAAGCSLIFERDHTFIDRLHRLYPLYGLRWCLILLNEFLPERWARRRFAGASDQTEAAARQLAKAETLLRTLTDDDGRCPYLP